MGCKSHRMRLLAPVSLQAISFQRYYSDFGTEHRCSSSLVQSADFTCKRSCSDGLGFYRHYFLFPKRDGGFSPILNLRHLNHVLMKCLFKMLTLKHIQICQGDSFLLVDLKDAYLYIQICIWGGGLVKIQSWRGVSGPMQTRLFPLWGWWESTSWITLPISFC